MSYNPSTIEISQTEIFARWFEKLRDETAKARINLRIRRLSLGNFGDIRYVGEKVSELRIDHGPGYRVYFMRQSEDSVVIVLGGSKAAQQRDIERAQELARQILKSE